MLRQVTLLPPPQAWLASRGPLLQQMATQQHLWGEVAAAVQVGARAAMLRRTARAESGTRSAMKPSHTMP